MNFDFDETEDGIDAGEEQEECEQVNLNFAEEFQNEMTLEGISGMVNLSGGEGAAENMFASDQGGLDDLPTAFDDSLNLQKQATSENAEATLEEHVISIDSNNLDDLSKKANLDAILASN